MNSLTRVFFCTFVVILSSCEPDELNTETENQVRETFPVDVVGDTGGNEGDVIDDKKT